MNKINIKEEIILQLKKIAPEVDEAFINFDKPIREQVDLDSIDYLRFIEKVSNLFEINFKDQDFEQISSISSMAHYIEELKTSRH